MWLGNINTHCLIRHCSSVQLSADNVNRLCPEKGTPCVSSSAVVVKLAKSFILKIPCAPPLAARGMWEDSSTNAGQPVITLSICSLYISRDTRGQNKPIKPRCAWVLALEISRSRHVGHDRIRVVLLLICFKRRLLHRQFSSVHIKCQLFDVLFISAFRKVLQEAQYLIWTRFSIRTFWIIRRRSTTFCSNLDEG